MKVRLTMNDGSVREIGEVYRMEEVGLTREEESRLLGFPEWYGRFLDDNFPLCERGKDKGKYLCRHCGAETRDYRHMREHGWTVQEFQMPAAPPPPFEDKSDGVFEDPTKE